MSKKIKERIFNFLERKNEELEEKAHIPKLKDANEFSAILSQMEKLVQGKIDALKSSLPIFFWRVNCGLFSFYRAFSLEKSNAIIQTGLQYNKFLTKRRTFLIMLPNEKGCCFYTVKHSRR